MADTCGSDMNSLLFLNLPLHDEKTPEENWHPAARAVYVGAGEDLVPHEQSHSLPLLDAKTPMKTGTHPTGGIMSAPEKT